MTDPVPPTATAAREASAAESITAPAAARVPGQVLTAASIVSPCGWCVVMMLLEAGMRLMHLLVSATPGVSPGSRTDFAVHTAVDGIIGIRFAALPLAVPRLATPPPPPSQLGPLLRAS